MTFLYIMFRLFRWGTRKQILLSEFLILFVCYKLLEVQGIVIVLELRICIIDFLLNLRMWNIFFTVRQTINK